MSQVKSQGLAVAGWTVVATAVNAAATATKAANASTQVGLRHYILGYSFSFKGGAPAVGTLQVKNGSTVLDQVEIPISLVGPIIVDYVHPLRCDIQADASITVGALGAGVTGTVVLRGATAGA